MWNLIRFSALSLGMLAVVCPSDAGEYVNGYTYAPPSYYLTPPVVVTGPYFPPPMVTVYEPAFLHTTVVPYDPVWPNAYMHLPGTYYRERVSVRPREVEYRLKTYNPRGVNRSLRYEVEYDRRGMEVEMRVR